LGLEDRNQRRVFLREERGREKSVGVSKEIVMAVNRDRNEYFRWGNLKKSQVDSERGEDEEANTKKKRSRFGTERGRTC